MNVIRPYLSLTPAPDRGALRLGPRGDGREGAADIRIPCRGGSPVLGSSGVADCSREFAVELGADDDDGVDGRLGGRMVKDIGADMAAA